MRQLNLLLTAILVIVGAAIPSKSEAIVNQAMADSIVHNLTAGTPADTIRQLYNAFDLSAWKHKGDVGFQILDVARRAGDHTTMADQLCQLSSIYMADSTVINRLLVLADELPDGEEKKSVKLFVKVESATGEATYLSPEERNTKLMKYVKEDITPKHDLYEDIYDLYCTVIFLGKESKGNMYLEYIDRLEKMIKEMPADNYAIRNLFYTSASIFYTQNNYPEKAIESDKELLHQIEQLEKMYKARGRVYRNYDRYYYICYRRMLRNHSALTLDEVKDLYARCARLAEKDEEVRNDFENKGKVTAYRLLAEKDYAGAIPHLKKALGIDLDTATRRELLGFLVAAADSVGDNVTLLSALRDYNNILLEDQRVKSQEALRELQIRYDVNSLQAEKNKLELEKRDLEHANDEKLISIVLVCLFVMAIVLMLLCRSYFRLKADKRTMAEDNEKLKKTIEELLNDGKPAGSTDLHNFRGPTTKPQQPTTNNPQPTTNN